MWSKHPRAVLTLICIAVGYIGAALFYWRWWPSNTPLAVREITAFACPVCPHIDSLGTDWEKFATRTAILGFLNACFFVAVGWFGLGATLVAKRLSSDRS